MPRAKQRTPALREHLLDVATELLAEQGPAGLTARGVAQAAGTSAPAIYELFGDKGGLIRAVFFEGFRQLHNRLSGLEETADPRLDLVQLAMAYRSFFCANPELAQVMFSRPFTTFDPSAEEAQASGSVRIYIVQRVRRWTDVEGIAAGATDIAHALVALIQGLASAESASRLGTSKASVDRRWSMAINALLDGFQRSARS